jgi:adenylate kinase
MNIIFLGAPGSGKGTQASLVANEFDLKHLSTGEMLRKRALVNDKLGTNIKETIEKGLLVDDKTMLKILKEEFKSNKGNKGYLLDGYPRNIAQAKALDEIMLKLGRKIDVVINLKINKKVVLQRITGRRVCKCGESYHNIYKSPAKKGICDKCGEALYQRADDNKESVKVRLKEYKKLTKPLITYYKKKKLLTNIDALQSVEDVSKDIKKVLEVYK